MSRSPALPCAERGVKVLQDRFRIGGKAIADKHNRFRNRSRRCTHLADETVNQALVTRPCYFALQEQTRAHTHSGCHPDSTPLRLDPQFINLHLTQGNLTITNNRRLNVLGMGAGFAQPIGERALRNAERCDHCLDGTPVRQKGQDECHDPLRIFQVIQRCALGFGESGTAGVTLVAPFRMGMHADTTSGMAVRASDQLWAKGRGSHEFQHTKFVSHLS